MRTSRVIITVTFICLYTGLHGLFRAIGRVARHLHTDRREFGFLCTATMRAKTAMLEAQRDECEQQLDALDGVVEDNPGEAGLICEKYSRLEYKRRLIEEKLAALRAAFAKTGSSGTLHGVSE